ncbi:hypothetical protein SDC9_118964 [bioreactor metagenome]|uniref:Uncharacterized protein n=1 Tax=bioreactor metagenome TaxID=1076179 RepID=A0A645C4U2_9ZZZZ
MEVDDGRQAFAEISDGCLIGVSLGDDDCIDDVADEIAQGMNDDDGDDTQDQGELEEVARCKRGVEELDEVDDQKVGDRGGEGKDGRVHDGKPEAAVVDQLVLVNCIEEQNSIEGGRKDINWIATEFREDVQEDAHQHDQNADQGQDEVLLNPLLAAPLGTKKQHDQGKDEIYIAH